METVNAHRNGSVHGQGKIPVGLSRSHLPDSAQSKIGMAGLGSCHGDTLLTNFDLKVLRLVAYLPQTDVLRLSPSYKTHPRSTVYIARPLVLCSTMAKDRLCVTSLGSPISEVCEEYNTNSIGVTGKY